MFQILLGIITILSWLSIFHVLQSDRKPEVTIGWVLALFFLTPIALPAYWIFGFRRYHGYARTLRKAIAENEDYVKSFFDQLSWHKSEPVDSFSALQSLTPFPLTKDNNIELLIDGTQTFDSIFKCIEQARHYILIQYFIIEDDIMGRKLMELLVAKAKDGVRIYLLFDYFGTRRFHRKYAADMKELGIQAKPFRSPRIHRTIYHINFRNHRKIVIVDGQTAFTGGLNVGRRYLGKSAGLRNWRDTHVKVAGPVALELQATFLSDWFWTSGETIPNLHWESFEETLNSNQTAAVFPTGPADIRPVCILKILALIHQAETRLWIATPYLIPNEAISMALEAAVLRGVDVRIITTGEVDHYIVFFAGWFYAEQLRRAGVRVYRMNDGFMHQKIILVDHKLASVGTINLDPRSFVLNFEVTVISPDPKVISDVETMLIRDLEASNENTWEWDEIGPFRRTTARFLRLFSPLI